MDETMKAWTLKNRRAVITGSTKGIGRAIAREFAELGAAVCIVSRTEKQVEETAGEMRGQGYSATGFAGDVACEEDRTRLAEKITGEWGGLDILVNNVGTNIRKPTIAYSAEDLRKVLQVNVESAFDLCTRFYPLLKAADEPVIINISSIASQSAVLLSSSAYSMSKAAMTQMTNFLAVEWGADGIRVNSVHPWYINTPLVKSVLSDPEKRTRIISGTPLGRVGEPQEVARAAAFLAMPAAGYISGVNLQVDGAFSKRGL